MISPEPLLPSLAAELLHRQEQDQAVRRLRSVEPTFTELAHIRAVDQDNTAALRRIVAVHGWPGRSLVGDEAAEAAWLLAQHSDADPEFQELALRYLTDAADAGEAELRHVAYLSDRVRLHAGLPQLYGTQYTVGPEGVVLHPVAEPEGLAERRAAVGLPPHEEYDDLIRLMYESAAGEGGG